MNQRVHNLTKWQFVADGGALRFSNVKPRVVILEVNCPGEVCFYVQQDVEDLLDDPERVADDAAGRQRPSEADRDLAFVGVCKGRDRLEFAVVGAFDLIVEGGGAYVYTFDGQDIATRVVAPVVFTRLANRKQRNPHLEMIEYRMKLNQQRFLAELELEQEARLEAIKHDLASYLPDRVFSATNAPVGQPSGHDVLAAGEPEEVVEDVKPATKRKRKSVLEDDDGEVPF